MNSKCFGGWTVFGQVHSGALECDMRLCLWKHMCEGAVVLRMVVHETTAEILVTILDEEAQYGWI